MTSKPPDRTAPKVSRQMRLLREGLDDLRHGVSDPRAFSESNIAPLGRLSGRFGGAPLLGNSLGKSGLGQAGIGHHPRSARPSEIPMKWASFVYSAAIGRYASARITKPLLYR